MTTLLPAKLACCAPGSAPASAATDSAEATESLEHPYFAAATTVSVARGTARVAVSGGASGIASAVVSAGATATSDVLVKASAAG